VKGRTLLIVEDGTEYREAFRRLTPAGGEVELLHARDGAAARRILRERRVDAVFLDVVFDRTPAEDLEGDLDALLPRFGGDRGRAIAHLAAHQGFYIARALAPDLPAGAPVAIAWDGTAEPGRLAALRESLPQLSGVPEGTPLSEVLASLLG
jgi:hypothetical protein